mgnify:CR=1 FL=1
MFSVTFPPAALLALGNNVLEFYADAHKLLRIHRRVKYEGAVGITPWDKIFRFLEFAGVFTNTLIYLLLSEELRSLPPASIVRARAPRCAAPRNWPARECGRIGHAAARSSSHGLRAAQALVVLAVAVGVTLLKALISMLIPDVPASVLRDISKEKWIAGELSSLLANSPSQHTGQPV